ncbi:MAG: ADP-ribosylation factor-like protein [candidate division KSB1 bacterium]|nr:ADP-ribosylation factor-like protein [candidate division KSB1 bacterium]MDZ7364918.1 ADP-ribosylation factor-like protein [candidate division KSB1 bacterium]MDZ7403019.1 ADP-ribosylation factor-like protein [candidate division KSB1 bacterium]
MFVNWALQEVNLKIVYYGPGLSGKTTNLEYIYRKIDPSLRGDLITLKTREERTLYFDFLQLEVGRIKGMKPKFNLYTIPGQVYYSHSRRIILRGVDGVVFVADSQADRLTENLDSLMDLEQNLIANGQSLDNFPWVLQYNKRDLPRILPVSELNAKLNFHATPAVEAVAYRGVGVLETLKAAIQSVVGNVQKVI